ncbi:hypothetical protein BH09MYX1_BH09MYX1_56370 [soil metagenome]
MLVADDGNNRIRTYRDGVGFPNYADLPVAPTSGPGLGQVIRSADGTVVVTRFGAGTAGDVVAIKPDHTSSVFPGLDPAPAHFTV